MDMQMSWTVIAVHAAEVAKTPCECGIIFVIIYLLGGLQHQAATV